MKTGGCMLITSHFLSMLSTLEVGYPCRTRMLLAKMQDSNSWIRRHMRGMKQAKSKTVLPLRAYTTLSFKQTPWFFGQPHMKLTQKWLCLWYDGMAYQDLHSTVVVFPPFSCNFSCRVYWVCSPGILALRNFLLSCESGVTGVHCEMQHLSFRKSLGQQYQSVVWIQWPVPCWDAMDMGQWQHLLNFRAF